MPKIIINRWGYNIGTGGYSTLPHIPAHRIERRIKMPQVPKRPLRFQVRTIIRHAELRKDTYWFTLHRRGPYRKLEGIDPLEARAVPEDQVRGTLPERILYKSLVDDFSMLPWFDFVFQSSLQGGRINLGGIVADFVFELMHIVIQVDGPTHAQSLRIHKDNEQDLALNEMGFQVYHLPEDTIYDKYRFDSWMDKTFGWAHSGGADSSHQDDMVDQSNGFTLDILSAQVNDLKEIFDGIA